VRILKLTMSGGRDLFIVADKIEAIAPADNGSHLFCVSREYYAIQESPKEIVELLEAEGRKNGE